MWDCWVSPGDKQGLCSFQRLYMGLFMKYFDHHVKWRPIMLVFAGSPLTEFYSASNSSHNCSHVNSTLQQRGSIRKPGILSSLAVNC